MLCMIDWTNLAVIYEMWCCEQVHESMRKLCVVIRFRPGQVAQRWHANWFLTEELDWVACDDGYQGMWVLAGRAQLVKVTLVPRRWFFHLNAFHCSLLLVHLRLLFSSGPNDAFCRKFGSAIYTINILGIAADADELDWRAYSPQEMNDGRMDAWWFSWQVPSFRGVWVVDLIGTGGRGFGLQDAGDCRGAI